MRLSATPEASNSEDIIRVHLSASFLANLLQAVSSWHSVGHMTNAFEGLEEALGTQIKVELVERGMDQKTLAERVGIHPVTMTKYLKNQRNMPVSVLIDIAGALGISPRALMQAAESRISQQKARRA